MPSEIFVCSTADPSGHLFVVTAVYPAFCLVGIAKIQNAMSVFPEIVLNRFSWGIGNYLEYLSKNLTRKQLEENIFFFRFNVFIAFLKIESGLIVTNNSLTATHL